METTPLTSTTISYKSICDRFHVQAQRIQENNHHYNHGHTPKSTHNDTIIELPLSFVPSDYVDSVVDRVKGRIAEEIRREEGNQTSGCLPVVPSRLERVLQPLCAIRKTWVSDFYIFYISDRYLLFYHL